MPIVTSAEVTAYAHCAQQVDDGGSLAFDGDGLPYGTERCEGYRQQKVRAIRELTEHTYLDGGADANDPVARMVERGFERLLWLDESDAACPHCGSRRELSDQLRPQYSSLGGPRGSADQLLEDRRARRRHVEATVAASTAAERQADALEKANVLEERRTEALEEANRLERIRLGLEDNGHGGEQRTADLKPRPARRRSPA